MADIKALAASRGTLVNFDPRKLKIKEGLNARDLQSDRARLHVEWLIASIRAVGLKEPLTIFPEGEHVYVEDGHCRLMAIWALIDAGHPIETIPCIPRQKGSDDIDTALAQTIHNTGLTLAPIEAGDAFKRAIRLGASVEVIAKRTGYAETTVRTYLELVETPVALQTMVRNNNISATTAIVAARHGLKAIKKVTTIVQARQAAGQKAKVTPKDFENDDPLWWEFRSLVTRHKSRPHGMTDPQIESAMMRIKHGGEQ